MGPYLCHILNQLDAASLALLDGRHVLLVYGVVEGVVTAGVVEAVTFEAIDRVTGWNKRNICVKLSYVPNFFVSLTHAVPARGPAYAHERSGDHGDDQEDHWNREGNCQSIISSSKFSCGNFRALFPSGDGRGGSPRNEIICIHNEEGCQEREKKEGSLHYHDS